MWYTSRCTNILLSCPDCLSWYIICITLYISYFANVMLIRLSFYHLPLCDAHHKVYSGLHMWCLSKPANVMCIRLSIYHSVNVMLITLNFYHLAWGTSHLLAQKDVTFAGRERQRNARHICCLRKIQCVAHHICWLTKIQRDAHHICWLRKI